MDFLIRPLPADTFRHLLSLDDHALRAHHARWVTADAHPGYPCRVSLQDAHPGERVLALPFTHHDVAGPYRASGPIYVREHADTVQIDTNAVPAMLRQRDLSLRAYDRTGWLRASTVCAGADLEQAIDTLFADAGVDYLHVHNAAPGCYNCTVLRA